MSRRTRIAAATVAAIAVVVGLALFQPWRLLTRSTVDEAVPVAATAATTTPSTTAGPDQMPHADATSGSGGTSVPAQPTTLAQGRFVDGEHATSGTARVIELADGRRYVRLEGFSTSDGPDVHVWLTDQPAGGTNWGRYDDGRSVALGRLKATDGNQNYAIPGDTDLDGLTSVVIWCDRFNVAFGSAPLRAA